MSTCDCWKYHYKSCKCADYEKQAMIFVLVVFAIVVVGFWAYCHFSEPGVSAAPELEKPPRVEQVIRYRT